MLVETACRLASPPAVGARQHVKLQASDVLAGNAGEKYVLEREEAVVVRLLVQASRNFRCENNCAADAIRRIGLAWPLLLGDVIPAV